MALHCFNLFFPCTNILQGKYMHRRSLFIVLQARRRQNSQQFRDWTGGGRNVCEIFAGPAVCGPGGGGHIGEGGTVCWVEGREAYFQPLLLAGMLAM